MKKVVAERKFPRQGSKPHLGSGITIMPHHQRAAVAPGDKAVITSAIDLHLVVIEGMHQIAGDKAVRQQSAIGRSQSEGAIGKAADRVLSDLMSRPVQRLWLSAPAHPISAAGLSGPSHRGRAATSCSGATADSGCARPGKLENRLLKLRFSA